MVELEGIAPSRVKALLAEQLQSLHSGIAPFKWWTCGDSHPGLAVLTGALFTCLRRAWFPGPYGRGGGSGGIFRE